MIPVERVLQETQQLERRGNRLNRAGWRLLFTGTAFAAVAAGSWLAAFAFAPTADSFALDLPESIITLAREMTADGVFRQITDSIHSGMLAVGTLILPFMAAGFMGTSTLKGISAFCDYLKERLNVSRKLQVAVWTTLSLVLIPPVSYFSWDAASKGLEDYSTNSLVSDLETKSVTPERKASWDYQYVMAQKAVLSGQPQQRQVQEVLKDYTRWNLHYPIPVPVRYALEMQAYGHPLSDEARRFQAVHERKVRLCREVSLYASAGALLLALSGLLARLTGKTLRRRVSFLRTIR